MKSVLSNPSDETRPSVAKIEMLRRRSQLMQRTREFFLEQGFIEVDTPTMSQDTVVDRYIEPIEVHLDVCGQIYRRFLQTSPEFAMKRLVAAGADAIFQLGKAFRAGEAGRLHQPEFTMLEWYRTADDYEQGRALLDQFVQQLLSLEPARQLTYRQAFIEFVKIDPIEATDAELRDCMNQRDSNSDGATNSHDDRDGLLNLILSEIVEPALAEFESVIIYDWPASQSALAKIRDDGSHPVAERFEIYVRGIELANGYHELTDAEELIRRNESVNRQRLRDGRDELPLESGLLETMRAGLPACCGTALGFDRLVMLALGETDISKVIPFDFKTA